jgi:hypothetical protein
MLDKRKVGEPTLIQPSSTPAAHLPAACRPTSSPLRDPGELYGPNHNASRTPGVFRRKAESMPGEVALMVICLISIQYGMHALPSEEAGRQLTKSAHLADL